MLIFIALLLLPILSCSQPQQCTYKLEVKATSFQEPCNTINVTLYDSWDLKNHNPLGKSVQFSLDSCDGVVAHGPCVDFCTMEATFPPAQPDIFSTGSYLWAIVEGNNKAEEFSLEISADSVYAVENKCEGEAPQGYKVVDIQEVGTGLYQLLIPESCNAEDLYIYCDNCHAPAPPTGGECSYDIHIKTSCKAFSGNPFGTVSVSIADDIGSSAESLQLAGHIESFENLDNPGVVDFAVCTLAKFTRTSRCMNFCSMMLSLDNTGFIWRVDYVEISSKYVTRRFDLYVTLKPSHAIIIGDYASVVASQCVPPPRKYFEIDSNDRLTVSMPETCEYHKDSSLYDNSAGWVDCECTKAHAKTASFTYASQY